MNTISNLHESIRSHIISFLPMKDAFQSSVLSKQWKDLCNNVPDLKFDQLLFKNTKLDFKDCVDQIIGKRDGSSIRRFKLCLDDDSYAQHTNAWISWVVRRNVKELLISANSRILDPIPCCVFTCISLTSLHLDNIKLNIRGSFALPLLIRLVFEEVEFSDDNQTSRLISACPILEYLVICQCSWKNTNVLSISASHLLELVLAPSCLYHDIRISCAKLQQLNYIGNIPDISLETLSSLCEVSFLFHDSDLTSEDVQTARASRILMGMQSVVKLDIGTEFAEIITRNQDRLTNPTAMCCLEYLSMSIKPIENEVKFVYYLLRSYPGLEYFSLCFQGEYKEETLSKEIDIPPKRLCIDDTLKLLKTVTIRDFKGSEIEMGIVKYLLKNANILEKMEIIYANEFVQYEERTVIKERFAHLARASPIATINIKFPRAPIVYNMHDQF